MKILHGASFCGASLLFHCLLLYNNIAVQGFVVNNFKNICNNNNNALSLNYPSHVNPYWRRNSSSPKKWVATTSLSSGKGENIESHNETNETNENLPLAKKEENIYIPEDKTKKKDSMRNSASTGGKDPSARRRELQLSWCGRDSCDVEAIREKVIGPQNQVEFEAPATGQVMCEWVDHDTTTDNDSSKRSIINGNNQQQQQIDKYGSGVQLPRVLILVKGDNDELVSIAADAVRELVSKEDIMVLLTPDVAAKTKYYFGVDDGEAFIQLFEPKRVPGFGGNHISDSLSYTYDLDDAENPIIPDPDGPDLICTIGGDGSLMYANLLFPGSCPPILCISGGSLGFLTPFSKEEIVDAIRKTLDFEDSNNNDEEDDEMQVDDHDLTTERNRNALVPSTNSKTLSETMNTPSNEFFGANNRICLSMRMRLDCRVINREGIVRARFNVLNEVVIDRGASPYLANLECFCDNVHLTTVQADGIIFATPTGSTAYSMAAGGSVVHPAVPAILVTPICPHVLSFRSMVFPDHVVLRCYVPDDARADAYVSFDGKYRRELHRGDSVQIQMSVHPVPTINRLDHSSDWLHSLKKNFNFNTRTRQKPL